MYEWRTGRSCLFKNNVHLVFVTKYRHKAITKEMLSRLKEIFIETCIQLDCELLEFGGEDDHVHLMVSIPPLKYLYQMLLANLRGSFLIFYWEIVRQKLWGNYFWSPIYCVVSVGKATFMN